MWSELGNKELSNVSLVLKHSLKYKNKRQKLPKADLNIFSHDY